MKKNVQFLVFEEIVNKIANSTHLKLLSMFCPPNANPMADFIWSQRIIKIQMEDNHIIVMGKKFDLVNPKVFENIIIFIKKSQKDLRMLPRHASMPSPHDGKFFIDKYTN